VVVVMLEMQSQLLKETSHPCLPPQTLMLPFNDVRFSTAKYCSALLRQRDSLSEKLNYDIVASRDRHLLGQIFSCA